MNTLYITGAGVSSASGIPTFRGANGFWTIGSKNYTPQEMATRRMYLSNPLQFLLWYYKRFIVYKDHGPNDVHYWLADKNLITQNIDGLDGKAGNKNYIAIHGRIDKATLLYEEGDHAEIIDAPWGKIDKSNLEVSLLEQFFIQDKPKHNISLKPYVLLFDEYYTEMYRISEAKSRMLKADKMIFIGTSFSVNILLRI
jgi:NAD-dependent deacetylase